MVSVGTMVYIYLKGNNPYIILSLSSGIVWVDI